MNVSRVIAITCVAICSAVFQLTAKTYTGNGIHVIDQIAFDHPDLRIGVDPNVVTLLLNKEITINTGDDWTADLENTLELHDLYVKTHKSGWLIVTDAVSYELYRSRVLMGQHNFSDAHRSLRIAVKKAPDSLHVVFLRKIASRLASSYPQLRMLNQTLNNFMISGKIDNEFKEILIDYDNRSRGFLAHTWNDYLRLLKAGLAIELYPILSVISGEMKDYIYVVESLQRSNRINVYQSNLNELRSMNSKLDDSVTVIKAILQKSKQQTARGIELFEKGAYNEALIQFSAAYELDANNFIARSYLGWIYSELRLKRMRELEDAKKSYEFPGKLETQINAENLAMDLYKRKSGRDAMLLMELMDQHKLRRDTLPRDFTEDSDWVTRSFQSEGSIGTIDGLVTSGAEFSGGEIYPVSITMGPRTNRSSTYELIINDNATGLDADMINSITQALGWLDEYSKGILASYSITVHFEDFDFGKSGDSMGATFAIAAFSSLYELEIPNAVTMSGSIRAYGGIAPIGGTYAKTMAALDAGKGVVIMPADNESEFNLLSEEDVQGIRVILADDISDYVFHTFRGLPKDELLWWKIDDTFRLGRIYEKLNLLPQALSAYRYALELCPNDYSARRAVDRLTHMGLQSDEQSWLAERMPSISKVMSTSRQTKVLVIVDNDIEEDPQNDKLKTLASDLASHAAGLMAETPASPAAKDILDFATFLNAWDRQCLLLKGKIMKSIEIDVSEFGSVDADDLKQRVLSMAKSYYDNADYYYKRLGILYYLMITDYLDPENADALIAIASYEQIANSINELEVAKNTGKSPNLSGPLKFSTLFEIIKKWSDDQKDPENETGSDPVLTPKKVKTEKKLSRPGKGYGEYWTEHLNSKVKTDKRSDWWEKFSELLNRQIISSYYIR